MTSSTGLIRPKPWETNDTMSNIPTNAIDISNNRVDSHTPDVKISPDLPERPKELNDDIYNMGTSNLRNHIYPHGSMYGTGNLYGNSMYGGYGSMYNNGIGNIYGGGFGSMYGSSYGPMYATNNSNNQTLAESTQATFQLIEGLIATVTGFSQMLESTYMATHNSFFAMMSIAEQFQYLKEIMGSFFGIFALMKFLKRILFKISCGKLGSLSEHRLPSNNNPYKDKLLSEFNSFRSFVKDPLTSKKRKRISWKPLLLFSAAVFGFPYLLNRLIISLQQVQKQRITHGDLRKDFDLKKLEFARAIYDFESENPKMECNLKKGDLMAILSKQDFLGNESHWWKVRTKKGDVGYVPSNYIEIIKRQKKAEIFNEVESNVKHL